MSAEQMIKNWLLKAKKDIETANDLYKAEHYDWCLFIWHLAIEKVLKAKIISLKKEYLSINHKNTMNKSTLVKMAKKYALHIEMAGIFVEKVYIFGSSITGKAHRGSDIDICIVSPNFGKDRLSERVTLMKLQEGISDLIEPHPFSPEDFLNPYDPLSYQIKKLGLRVV